MAPYVLAGLVRCVQCPMTNVARGTPPPVRPAVASMKPYVPGRSIESVRAELGIDRFVKLNQNENPLGPSPRALTAIEQALRDVSLYPDGTVPSLRARLAAHWALPADRLLVGNGSDEIFRLLAEVYIEPGDAVVLPTPSFAGYALVAQLMGGRVVAVPLAGDTMDLPAMAEAATRERAPLVFLCRPNNPTGGVFAEDSAATLPGRRARRDARRPRRGVPRVRHQRLRHAGSARCVA